MKKEINYVAFSGEITGETYFLQQVLNHFFDNHADNHAVMQIKSSLMNPNVEFHVLGAETFKNGKGTIQFALLNEDNKQKCYQAEVDDSSQGLKIESFKRIESKNLPDLSKDVLRELKAEKAAAQEVKPSR